MKLQNNTTTIESNEIFVNGIIDYYKTLIEAKASESASSDAFVLNIKYKSETFRSLGFEVELVLASELSVASLPEFANLVLSYSRSYEIIKKLESFILESFDKTNLEIIGLSGFLFYKDSAEAMIKLLLDNRPELQCLRLEKECHVTEHSCSFGPLSLSLRIEK